MLKRKRKKVHEVGYTLNIWNRYGFRACAFEEDNRLVATIKHIGRCIKWSKQRIVRGYADRDVWDMCGYLQMLLPDMLEHMKKNRVGSPVFLGGNYSDDNCHEEWDKILDRMIFLWRESDEEKCSKKKLYKDEQKLVQYRNKCKDEAMDLMKEYFFSLWD